MRRWRVELSQRLLRNVVGRSAEVAFKDVVSLVCESLKDDCVRALKAVVLEWLAGSRVMPKAGRHLIYRMCGLDFLSTDVAAGQVFHTLRVHLGCGSVLEESCYFDGKGAVYIGDDVIVGQGVMFLTSDHPVREDGSFERWPVYRDIHIGNNVRLGTRAIVGPGCHVGDGCTVSAASYVSGDCEPGVTYAGVPARRAKHGAHAVSVGDVNAR